MKKKAPVTEERLAARAVALRENLTLAERRELLDILGLVNDDGDIVELDPSHANAKADYARVHGQRSNTIHHTEGEKALLSQREHLPPGLRDLGTPPKSAAS